MIYGIRGKREQENETITLTMVLYVVIVNEDLASYVFFPPYLDRTITPEEINSEILKKQT